MAAVVCICDIVGLSIFTAVSFNMIQSLGTKVDRGIGDILRPIPDIIGTVLPAAIGDVTHKRYVGSIVLVVIVLGSVATISLFYYATIEDVSDWSAIRSVKHAKSLVFFVIACFILTLSAIRMYTGTLIFDYLFYPMVWQLTALFECLVWGWLRYSKHQVNRVGSYATYTWMFICNVLGGCMAVALIPIVNCMSKIKLPTSTPPFVYRTLPQIVCYVVYGVIFVVLTVLVCLNARKVYRNVGLNSAASSPRLQQQPWSHHLSSGLIPRRRFLGLAHFPRGDFPRGDFSRGDFSRGDFPRGDFPRGDFPRGDFPRGDFPRGDFPVADCPTDFPRNNAQDDLIGTAKGDIGRRRLSRRRLRQSLRFSRKPSRVTPSLMKPSLVRPTLNERLQTGAGYRAEGYRGEEAFREGGFLEGGFREGGFREGGFRERRTKPLVRGPYWWLLLGNIELFRYDLNSLLCGNSIFRVDVFWSMSIKYSAPLLLTLLLYHQAEDADGSISGNRFTRGYLGVMNPEIVPTNRFQLKMSVNIPIAVALCAALLTTTISIRNPGFCRRLGPPSSSIPAMSWWPRREFNLRGPRAWQTLKQLFFLEFTRHRSQDLDEHSSEEPDNFAAAEKCADIILGRIDDSDDQHIPETSDDLFS